MALITYIEHDGSTRDIEVENGKSVMQGAVDNMIDTVVAECGGACSCATCHVYVDEAWIAKVDEAEDMERDMLELTVNPQANSRLSCQITVRDELDGLVVRIPEAQF